MKVKNTIAVLSLAVILGFAIYACAFANSQPVTYDGTDTDVVALLEDPSDYTIDDPEGVSDIIVKTNLEKTNAENVVTAILFDYRGFDTLGEAFILLTAIAGSFVILRSRRKRKEGEV